MTPLTSYLLVILIVLIILLTITYTTDYISIPEFPKFFDREEESSSSSDIEYEKKYKDKHPCPLKQLNQQIQSKQLNQSNQQIQSKQLNQQIQSNTDINNFLIETNESDNINNRLFSGADDFQMTETTGNAIADALRDI